MIRFWLTSILIILFFGANAQIKCEDYHIVRGAFDNSFTTFTKTKKGQVAYLGGSITFNPGWRDSTSTFIQKSFPQTKFEFINAGIPSMGSTPGAFRLERDVLSHGKIDLLIVEAAVNDPTNGRSSLEQIRAMEGIIRHARKSNPKMDIIVLYFVDPDKMHDYNEGKTPDVIKNHEMVAEHYQVSSINLAKEVTDRINTGEFTWKEDFKDLHPSPFGQIIYYNSIRQLLENEWTNIQTTNIEPQKHKMPEKLDAFCYDKGKLESIEKAQIIHGWKIEQDWSPPQGEGTRAGYTQVAMLISEQPGSEIILEFKGKAIGIAIAAGPDAGTIEYSIDGGDFKTLDLFTQWSKHLHLPWYYVLDTELSREKHTLIIRITDQKNTESTGNTCRIKHFFINEY